MIVLVGARGVTFLINGTLSLNFLHLSCHTVPDLRASQSDALSPAVLALIKSWSAGGSCGHDYNLCSHTDDACAASTPCYIDCVDEPCLHPQFEHVELGSVAVQGSLVGLSDPVLFLEGYAPTTLEQQLLREVNALRN